MKPPLVLVLGMALDERWTRHDFGRSYKLHGIQFRLYGVRELKSQKGAWYLHKLRDYRYWKYKGPTLNRPARDNFIKKAKDWAEQHADENGWVFVPEAKHFMRSTNLPESCQVLIELEVLAHRGE